MSVALFTIVFFARAAAHAGPLILKGSLSTTQAYDYLGTQKQLSLSQYDAVLRAQTRSSNCDTALNFRLHSDTFDNPSPTENLGIREAALTCHNKKLIFSLGKQSVVWGKADGFHVLDTVESFDYSQFFLDEPNNARIPLFMSRLEYRPTESENLQLLVIPDRHDDILPQNGGRFAGAWAPQVALASDSFSESTPSLIIPRQWSYGAQWEKTSNEIDYTINYLNRWASEPAYTYTTPFMPTLATPYRQQIYGGSFDFPLAKHIIRGEVVYSPINQLPVSTPQLPLGTMSYGELGYVIGFDHQFDTWFLSAQVFQNSALGGDTAPLGGRQTSLFTLLATKEFDQDQTKLQCFGTQDLSNGGTWLSAALQHQVSPSLNIGVRSDTFTGPQTSIFGRIHEQDRLSVTATKTW